MGKKYRGRETIALIRLHVLAEGQAEEGFVNEILAPALAYREIIADAHRISTGRHRGKVFRGGMMKYEHLARDLTLWMKEDQGPDSWFTTMVDYYALPDDFPGYAALPPNLPATEKVARLEDALGRDIANRLSGLPVARRFVPYIQIHEFEALLFSDTAAFAEAFPGQSAVLRQLAAIHTAFMDPEAINNSRETAPSKRILRLLPDYQKPVAGLLIAKKIGLEVIGRECRHFGEWMARLEALTSILPSSGV